MERNNNHQVGGSKLIAEIDESFRTPEK